MPKKSKSKGTKSKMSSLRMFGEYLRQQLGKSYKSLKKGVGRTRKMLRIGGRHR